MASAKPYRPKEPIHDAVPIFKSVQIGEAHSAADAFRAIGVDWDNASYAMTRGHYEFEMDDHRFLVHITPIEPLKLSTPFDDAVGID